MHKGKRIAVVCVALLPCSMALASTMLSDDYGKLMSRADITLNKPVAHNEEGMPIGNGRMGSLKPF